MNRAQKIAILLTCVCILAAAGYGQSLGDVARQQRQKQLAKDPNSSPRVITNDDIPSNSELPSSSDKSRHEDLSLHPKKTAEQWKAEIQAQKSAIAALQRQIDQVNASIHFATIPLSNGAARHNEQQVQKQENVKRLQAKLEELQQKLEDTQEAARKDGYGSSVYEP